MPDPHPREEEIFCAAIELDSPDARLAFVRDACVGDRALFDRLKHLLHLREEAESFWGGERAEAAGGASLSDHHVPLAEGPGTVIGRYKLLDLLGEGGFGVVYLAEQTEPVRRRVALKIIKLGMETKQVVARFEAERQALALMDHPNIAKALDGGATDSGRPYFVMELVRGVPLLEYCDANQLDVPARLELFLQVAQAIHHAHQKGVIHRDIKPSNVLVALVQDHPTPKVIDFGIAKATQQELTQHTLLTRHEEFIGTPAYMSPEQVRHGSFDIDTRTDIYSLGVLLYELLIGHTPIDPLRLMQDGPEAMRRMIREEDPQTPSARLAALPASAAHQVACHRRTDPKHLASRIKGDLDWIVMKCLEKDRARRYESANALVRDIRSHLLHEPVSAVAPSLTYRLGKFARRHRVALTAAGAVVLTLLMGVVASILFAIRATQAERIASTRLESETRARQEAQAVLQFFNRDLFAYADPALEPERDISLRTLLGRASAQIEGRFAHQPLVEAAVRLSVGKTYRNLGAAQEAEPHLRRAVDLRAQTLGPADVLTLEAQSELIASAYEQNQFDSAWAVFQTASQAARQSLGLRHPVTVELLGHGAWIAYAQGHHEEMLRLAREAAESAAQTPGIDPAEEIRTVYLLAREDVRQGRIADGESRLRDALNHIRSLNGPTHPSTLSPALNLASYMMDHELNLPEAEQLYLTSLDQVRRLYGESYHRSWKIRGNLVALYRRMNRPSDALFQELMKFRFRPVEERPLSLMSILQLLENVPLPLLDPAVPDSDEAWLTASSPPQPGWTQPDYALIGWVPLSQSAPSECWLRRSLNVPVLPADPPFLLARVSGRLEFFLNGLPANDAPFAVHGEWQAAFLSEAARATLRPGTNILAAHISQAPIGQSPQIRLYRIEAPEEPRP